MVRAARHHRRIYDFAVQLYNRLHVIDQANGTIIVELAALAYRRGGERVRGQHRTVWPTALYYLLTDLTFAVTAWPAIFSPQHALAQAIGDLLTFAVARELLLSKHLPYVEYYRQHRVDPVRLRFELRQIIGLFAPTSFMRALGLVRGWRRILNARRPPTQSLLVYAPTWDAERRAVAAYARRRVRATLRAVGEHFGDFGRAYAIVAAFEVSSAQPTLLWSQELPSLWQEPPHALPSAPEWRLKHVTLPDAVYNWVDFGRYFARIDDRKLRLMALRLRLRMVSWRIPRLDFRWGGGPVVVWRSVDATTLRRTVERSRRLFVRSLGLWWLRQRLLGNTG